MSDPMIEMALGGYEPPNGTFSVGVVDHRGYGGSAVFPLAEAALLFAEMGNTGTYGTLVVAAQKLLRKYKRKRRDKDLKRLALAGLATAIASPYCDFAGEFSSAVRTHNRAAVSLVFGKKRGLLIVVAERGFDDAGVLKQAVCTGLGPITIVNADEEGAMQ